MGLYLQDAWWNDLNELRSRTEKLYEKIGRDMWQVTAEKMIALRGWKIKESEVIPVLQELGAYYVPKKMIPGPMFVFPKVDAAGHTTSAQTKPLHDLFGPGKYHTLGVSQKVFLGPTWIGNTDETLEKILRLKSVTLAEGPFDLVAAKILAPLLPIMSSLTKSIGEKHVAYLKILGVQHLYLLFDHDEAGEKSKIILSKILDIPVEAIGDCPGDDPSGALKTKGTKDALRRVLKTIEEEHDD